jgi:hypothetical protein
MPKKKNAVARRGYDIISFSDAHANSLTDDDLLVTKEVAAILRVSPSIINKWRLEGKGPLFLRLGSRVRYRIGALRNYLIEQTRNSTSAEAAPPAA